MQTCNIGKPAGIPAIRAVERATCWNDREAAGRAFTVLSTYADADDSDTRDHALEAMPQLRHLRLTGARITRAGYERLRRALPQTRITW